MRLKHRCNKCKKDMSIELELIPSFIRLAFIQSTVNGNGRWCYKCREEIEDQQILENLKQREAKDDGKRWTIEDLESID